MTRPLTIEAPAKLNLSLHVVGRRDDGFHLLDSRLVLLELADRLLLLPGCSGLRIEGRGASELPLDDRNLAWRGLVAGLGTLPDLACLTLDKRIPHTAGLGGGSSDAAAAWRLGRAMRGASDHPDADDIAELASIGADVPFFAAGLPSARLRGAGEVVDPAPGMDAHAVLVHPPFGLSTAAVFAALRAEEWQAAENDLLAPALRLRPELGDFLDAVRRAGGEPRLTGSGPTIFCLDPDPERIGFLARRLSETGLSTTVTRTRMTPARVESIIDDEEEALDAIT